MSPELVNNRKYSNSVDIWSLGCVMYEMCAKEPPFKADNLLHLAKVIEKGKFKRIPDAYSD